MVCKINGLMVACCTLSGILMTISPVRWIMPKTAGFSVARVSGTGAPFRRRQRGFGEVLLAPPEGEVRQRLVVA